MSSLDPARMFLEQQPQLHIDQSRADFGQVNLREWIRGAATGKYGSPDALFLYLAKQILEDCVSKHTEFRSEESLSLDDVFVPNNLLTGKSSLSDVTDPSKCIATLMRMSQAINVLGEACTALREECSKFANPQHASKEEELATERVPPEAPPVPSSPNRSSLTLKRLSINEVGISSSPKASNSKPRAGQSQRSAYVVSNLNSSRNIPANLRASSSPAPMNAPEKELNILLIGETGVGKSTLINMFSLYERFGSVEDAMLEESTLVIPVHFTFDRIKVNLGHDENECTDPINSATLGARTYSFKYTIDGHPVRTCFIDTPGMGDTRGTAQDSLNMKGIIHHISHYREIHGICFLLKPNESRFTLFFKYCIEMLLQHLHKNILENAVICFTNTRCTNYKPGNTLSSLKKYLHDNGVGIPLERRTVYCFESEPVRYLALRRQCGSIDIADLKTASAESWKRTYSELKRLLEHILTLKPHATQETVGLNATLDMVKALHTGLPMLIKKLENEIAGLQINQDKLQRLARNEKLLENHLLVDIAKEQDVQLSHPVIQCTRCSCEVRCTALTTSQYLPYSFQQKDLIKSRQLQLYDRGTLCKYCRCSIAKHTVVTTRKSVMFSIVEDKNVRALLDNCKSEEEKISALIRIHETRRLTYEHACKEAQSGLSLCTRFLDENSAVSVQKRLQSLQQQLKEVENLEKYGDTSVDKQQLLVEISKLERQLVRVSVSSSARKISVEEINACIDRLKGLELIGDVVRRVTSSINSEV